jgi:hypothetical protein
MPFDFNQTVLNAKKAGYLSLLTCLPSFLVASHFIVHWNTVEGQTFLNIDILTFGLPLVLGYERSSPDSR